MTNEEQGRLQQAESGVRWRRWGPYLSERQWGTVREDPGQDPATPGRRSPTIRRGYRAYRWGEDGLAGICDDKQLLCLSVALWNERDPIAQGAAVRPDQLPGQPRRGRQGVLLLPRRDADVVVPEDALQVPAGASSPTTTWSPTNGARGKTEPEYELLDTGIFDDNRYFDVFVEYAKDSPGRPSHAGHRAQPGPGGGAAARAADALVPAHLVLGRRRRAAVAARRRPTCRGCSAVVAEHERTRRPLVLRRPAGAGAGDRERDQQRARIRLAERLALRQGRHRTGRRARRERQRSTRTAPGPRRPCTTS